MMILEFENFKIEINLLTGNFGFKGTYPFPAAKVDKIPNKCITSVSKYANQIILTWICLIIKLPNLPQWKQLWIGHEMILNFKGNMTGYVSNDFKKPLIVPIRLT